MKDNNDVNVGCSKVNLYNVNSSSCCMLINEVLLIAPELNMVLSYYTDTTYHFHFNYNIIKYLPVNGATDKTNAVAFPNANV